MKICVLVKQVPDKNDAIKLNSENLSVDKSNFNFVTNESDNYAVEEDKHGILSVDYNKIDVNFEIL